MRVPNQVLRETITIQDYAGQGARGPSYSAPRTARAAIQPTGKLVAGASGTAVAVDVVCIIRPEAGPVPIDSIITWMGDRYRVLAAFGMPDTRRPTHWELSLLRYAG